MVNRKARQFALTVMALCAAILLSAGIIGRRPLLEWAEESYLAWKTGPEIRFKVYDVSDLVYLAEPDASLKLSGKTLLESVERKLADPRAEAAILHQRMMVKATAWDHVRIKRLLASLRRASARHGPGGKNSWYSSS